VLGAQVAVVRHALVEVVGDEVEDVLLEVGAGAGDDLHLVLADHLGERQAELGGAHGAGEGDHHGAAALHVRDVGVGGVDQRGGVGVAVVVAQELLDGAGAGGDRHGRLLNGFERYSWAARGTWTTYAGRWSVRVRVLESSLAAAAHVT